MLRIFMLNNNDSGRKILMLSMSVWLPILFTVSCGRQSATQLPEPSSTQESTPKPSEITEVTLERTYSGCTDCRAYKVVLADGSGSVDESVTVALTDLKTNETRQGKLHRSTFDQLSRLIDSSHYFELSNAYGEGIVDSGDVTTTVVKNGIRKKILNRAEKGPIALWGIEMAIDGAIASANWQSATK